MCHPVSIIWIWELAVRLWKWTIVKVPPATSIFRSLAVEDKDRRRFESGSCGLAFVAVYITARKHGS